MAAGQPKKRLNSVDVKEQCREKRKKKVETCGNILKMRSHIFLKWDEIQETAVARRDQVGIAWRDIAPFIDPISEANSVLADVFPIPQEIFDLENIDGVLLYEVWETYLSVSEKKVLSQFLPKGTDGDEVVKSLLMGKNFHFGNPFLKWGSSFCSGDLHPDAVLQRERNFKANKRASYLELQQYHTDFVVILEDFKERWMSCKDLENDAVENFWRRSRGEREESLSSDAPDSGQHDVEGALSINPRSLLWDTNKKVSSVAGSKRGSNGAGPHGRKGLLKNNHSRAQVIPQSSVTEMQHGVCTSVVDGASLMSYIKISKKQHQSFKNMKGCGDGIQPKSFKRVLGDIRSFDIKPYEALLEEERKTLHEHWLRVATKDMPVAFESHGKTLLKRQLWRKSVTKELAEKVDVMLCKDEEEEGPESLLQDGEDHYKGEVEDDNRGADYQATIDLHNQEEREDSIGRNNRVEKHHGTVELLHEEPGEDGVQEDREVEHQATIDLHNQEKENSCNGDVRETEHPTIIDVHDHVEKSSIPLSDHSRPLLRIPSLNSHHAVDPMGVVQGEDGPILRAGAPSVLSQFLGNVNHAENMIPNGTWPMVDLSTPFYQSTLMTHGCSSAGELSLRQPEAIEHHRSNQVIDLERNLVEEEDGVSLLHGPSNGVSSALHLDNGTSLLFPYEHPVRSTMLPSYPEAQVNGIKEMLPFQSSRFPLVFQEQQQQGFYEQREVYPSVQKSGYTNGTYPSSQGHFSTDWAGDPFRNGPFQSVNGGLAGRNNWFPDEPHSRGGWPPVEASVSSSHQCIGGHAVADGSLFTVLSQCNNLQPQPQYDSRGTEQYIPSRNFSSVGISGNFNTYGYSADQPSIAPSLKMNDSTWMSLHQNSGSHDSMGNPPLPRSSWNQ
ncbi:hypothetical protein QJS04_geneDACA020995 [Acorus gramineus]|uniref:DEUBAD domain-containing protein n=1 Tax=Acorus gramineus TaxID=55184 RepID=A0AAV9B6V5_ACOGR|nr:hypothetical protein QJS04_geneDACA020995 [Acorus gramineus]